MWGVCVVYYHEQNASLKTREKSRTAALMAAPLTLLSDMDVADSRARISVSLGCRKFPGEGGGVEKLVELRGDFVGVMRTSCAFLLR